MVLERRPCSQRLGLGTMNLPLLQAAASNLLPGE
jgi:hypothetical protein